MADGVRVQVHGWREVRAKLGGLRGQLPKAVRDAAKDSAQLVVSDAKRRMPIGPGKNGHARSSIRSAATSRGTQVRGGGAKFPYYQFLEFGGRVGRKNSVYRKRIKKGRYIYPALDAQRAQMRRTLNRNLSRAARSSGLNVRGGG